MKMVQHLKMSKNLNKEFFNVGAKSDENILEKQSTAGEVVFN